MICDVPQKKGTSSNVDVKNQIKQTKGFSHFTEKPVIENYSKKGYSKSTRSNNQQRSTTSSNYLKKKYYLAVGGPCRKKTGVNTTFSNDKSPSPPLLSPSSSSSSVAITPLIGVVNTKISDDILSPSPPSSSPSLPSLSYSSSSTSVIITPLVGAESSSNDVTKITIAANTATTIALRPPSDDVTEKTVVANATIMTLRDRMKQSLKPAVNSFDDNFKFGEFIGGGAFGKVFHGRNSTTNQDVVIKVIKRETEDLPNEVKFMERLSHRHIVQFSSVHVTDTDIRIVMGVHGRKAMSLTDYVSKLPHICETMMAYFAKQIVNGLAYIHHEQIAHMDIKGDNIIINEYLQIKIIDFGIALPALDVNFDEPYYSPFGSTLYRSPEMVYQTGIMRGREVYSQEFLDSNKIPWLAMFIKQTKGFSNFTDNPVTENYSKKGYSKSTRSNNQQRSSSKYLKEKDYLAVGGSCRKKTGANTTFSNDKSPSPPLLLPSSSSSSVAITPLIGVVNTKISNDILSPSPPSSSPSLPSLSSSSSSTSVTITPLVGAESSSNDVTKITIFANTTTIALRLPSDDVTENTVVANATTMTLRDRMKQSLKPAFNSFDDNFKFGEFIGGGAFGKVFHGRKITTDQDVIIKVIKRETEDLPNEVKFMQRLSHRHVVQFSSVHVTDTDIRIVMGVHGRKAMSLTDYISKLPHICETMMAYFVKQIVNGLAYIHHEQIAHMDIKGDNIIINEYLQIKIIDFGIALPALDVNFDEPYYSPFGSTLYRSPEMVYQTGYYGPECDMWALGMTIYLLFTASWPFEYTAKWQIIVNKNVAYKPMQRARSKEMDAFLKSLFNLNIYKRMSSSSALQHPWLIGSTFSGKKLRKRYFTPFF